VQLGEGQGAVAAQDRHTCGTEGPPGEVVGPTHQGSQRGMVVSRGPTAVSGRGDGPQLIAELGEALGCEQPLLVGGEELTIEHAQIDEEPVAFDLAATPFGAAEVRGDAVEHESAGPGWRQPVGRRWFGHGVRLEVNESRAPFGLPRSPSCRAGVTTHDGAAWRPWRDGGGRCPGRPTAAVPPGAGPPAPNRHRIGAEGHWVEVSGAGCRRRARVRTPNYVLLLGSWCQPGVAATSRWPPELRR